MSEVLPSAVFTASSRSCSTPGVSWRRRDGASTSAVEAQLPAAGEPVDNVSLTGLPVADSRFIGSSDVTAAEVGDLKPSELLQPPIAQPSIDELRHIGAHTAPSSVESSASVSSPALASVQPPRPRRKFREVAVPASPLARLWGFGGMAMSLVSGAAGGVISGGSASPSHSVAQAERLAEGLCRMRGAALKIGQMLSLLDDGLLPPAIAAALERVRAQADVMPPHQLEAVMLAELGPSWRERLGGDSFDVAPVAAASIGQVHSSTLPDGRRVAIKVQYPGVADSIHSDIGNLRRLLRVSNFLPRGLYIDNIMKVAREELSAECNYELEALHQERFRALLADQPNIVVPAVVPELSTRRILVTEWLEGAPIDQVVESGLDQEARNEIARTLLRLTLQELFTWRFMQVSSRCRQWANMH